MKNFFTFFSVFALFPLFAAAPDADKTPHPPRRPRHFQFPQGQRQNNTPNLWRVFSQLSPAEQKEMMELQRTEPEKFRSAMQEKVEKLKAEMQAKRQKTNELAEKIRNSKDEKEKTELRKELRSILKNGFDARLAQMRRNIEANKKRLARMEADLKKREENSEAIVDAITDSIISGKKHPHPRKPMQK